ncbi:glycosyltransferase [Nocardia harenae]|uniref:glycosyltransferase n=1 Tax=Nocardia harenae TaxID=358707 RepID=UPI000830795D|nr:nucleotide disphospho-sugar-binding domain-containing protein [Nocardia harenae]
MKFLLAFNGTRGDVQPAVVAGAELQRRGHDVVLGVPPNLVEFAAAAGLDAHPFGYDTRAHMNSEPVQAVLRGGGPRQRLRALAEVRDLGWAQGVRDMGTLADGADAIVTGFVTEQIGLAYADARGIPGVLIQHAPIRPNRSTFPVPGVSPTLPGPVKAAGWWAAETAMWALTRNRQNALRRALGAPARAPRSPRATAEIQVYDPVLCPELAREWAGTNRPFTGFLDLTADQRARIGTDSGADLLEWIERGEPPLYVGFGSMPIADPAATVAAVTAACAHYGVRALVSGGWHDLPVPETETIRPVGAIDHGLIFPRCRAVLHHGGAGTTAAALRAGVPSLIAWIGSDQPFWGSVLERFGAGACTRARGLTTELLIDKLRTVLAPETAAGARALGARLLGPDEARTRCADALEASLDRTAAGAGGW